MHLEMREWRIWDQSRSVDNARRASDELTRARVAREEIDAFVARVIAGRRDAQSA